MMIISHYSKYPQSNNYDFHEPLCGQYGTMLDVCADKEVINCKKCLKILVKL